MKQLQEVLELLVEHGEVGVTSAHPDDEASHGHGITIARALGAQVYHLIYTKGESSTKNYAKAQGIRVERGDRIHEARAGAFVLGMAAVTVLGYEDGELQSYLMEATADTVAWSLEQNIHTLMALGSVDAHLDHLAARDIALRAAAMLNSRGHSTDVLEVRHENKGDILASATSDSMAAIFHNLHAHRSQARLSEEAVSNWIAVPGGLYMHPDDMEEFAQYPLLVDASYMHYPAESFTMAAIGELISR